MKRVEATKLYPPRKIADYELRDFHRHYVYKHGIGTVDSNFFIVKMREHFRTTSAEPTGRDVGRMEEWGLVAIKEGGTKIEVKEATPKAVRGQQNKIIMTHQEKENLIRDVLHDTKRGNGNLDAMLAKYNVTDTAIQAEIRNRWKDYCDDEKVRAAMQREANRTACGYAGNPADQSLIDENNKAVANLIDEGTKELLS